MYMTQWWSSRKCSCQPWGSANVEIVLMILQMSKRPNISLRSESHIVVNYVYTWKFVSEFSLVKLVWLWIQVHGILTVSNFCCSYYWSLIILVILTSCKIYTLTYFLGIIAGELLPSVFSSFCILLIYPRYSSCKGWLRPWTPEVSTRTQLKG